MEAIIVQKSPYAIEVESGSSYYWCSCGKSANQPFCDGSHKIQHLFQSNMKLKIPKRYTSVGASTRRQSHFVMEVIQSYK